jgi:hypothetical protein
MDSLKRRDLTANAALRARAVVRLLLRAATDQRADELWSAAPWCTSPEGLYRTIAAQKLSVVVSWACPDFAPLLLDCSSTPPRELSWLGRTGSPVSLLMAAGKSKPNINSEWLIGVSVAMAQRAR